MRVSPADRLIRALFRLTEGHAGQWRMIASLGKVGTAGAVDTAMREGLIEIEGGHSVRLTDAGRARGGALSELTQDARVRRTRRQSPFQK